MRQPLRIVRYLVILLALTFAARAHADDRAEARAHYQAGVKFYASADYRSAIREFSSAQQLAPADLNNYNLALCYDKLGDAEPAIQYYRAFLDRQPNTDKRAEIEASISRLEAASKSAASKKADEAKKLEAAPPAGPVLGPALPPGSPSAAPPPPAPVAGPVLGPQPPPAVEPARKPVAVGSIGTPSSAQPTGDAQLDRVQAINIDQIRDQRGAGGAVTDRRPAPGVAEAAPGEPGPPPQAATGPSAPPPVVAGADQQPAKRETPVYKKWWFWAVVAVSGYVVYELATSDSKSSQNGRGVAEPDRAGLTLLRW